MALTIEDGTGVSGADSFVTLAEAASYCTDMGLAWTGTDAAKESALRKAALFLGTIRWVGQKSSRDNVLCWPRVNVVDEDGYDWDSDVIPGQVKDAQIEVASLILGGDNPLSVQDRGGRVRKLEVDVLSIEYETGAPSGKVYPSVEAIIAPFVRGKAQFSMERG